MSIPKSLVVLLLCFVIGCDRLPQTASKQVNSVPPDAVAESGRGGYDWNVNKADGETAFEVTRPTSFQFVNELDDTLIKQNCHAVQFAENVLPSKPEWMDDDVYAWFRKFTEPHPEPKAVLEIPVTDEIGRQAFAVSRHGERMITVGTKIIEWEIETGKRLREFPAPVVNGLQITYDAGEETVIVSTADSLNRVSLSSGQVTHKWECPESELINFVIARDADVVLAVTKAMGMHVLANNFSAQRVYQGPRLLSKHVALQPAGKWAVATGSENLLRWRLDKPGNPVDTIAGNNLDKSVVALSGSKFDRWCDVNSVHEFNQESEKLTKRGGKTYVPLNSFPWHAATGSLAGYDDWIVLFADKGNFDGSTYRFLQDITTSRASLPWRIPVEGEIAICGDLSMQTIAIRSAKSINVYHRRAWVDADGDATATQIINLFSAGRLEQTEKILDYFRSQNAVRGNITGEDFYGRVVERIGARWKDLQSQQPRPEVLTQIESWHKQGSITAKLCSAEKNFNIGAAARGEEDADKVSQEAWKALRDHNALAIEELKEILATPQPPAQAMFTMINALRYAGGDVSNTEKVLKQHFELYPNNYAIFTSICYTLLPRWGGTEGEGGALVGALTSHLPEPERDIFYTHILTDMTRTFGRKILPETGLNEHRAARTALELMKQKRLTNLETELLMEIAHSLEDQELVQKLGRYHIENFALPGSYVFTRTGVDKLLEIRLDSLKAATKTQSSKRSLTPK